MNLNDHLIELRDQDRKRKLANSIFFSIIGAAVFASLVLSIF